MSRRRRPRDSGAPASRGGRADPAARDRADASGPRPARGGRILRDLVILLVAFGLGVGVAELFGAANLGVAFGVGQLVFAIVLVVLLTRG